jgi:hypothetical protein
VIRGKYSGRIFKVYEEWPMLSAVRLAIDKESWIKVEDVFPYDQIFRFK